MDTEQPQDSATAEDRLANLFLPPEAAKEPEQATEAPVEASDETPPEDDGLDDLDVDGTQYRIPRELKAKVSEWKEGQLRQEDYTRKTQEVADLRRQAQLTAEALQYRQTFEKETSGEREELARANADLKRYQEVNWKDLDLETMVRLRSNWDQLKDRARELTDSLKAKNDELVSKTEQHKRRSMEEGYNFLKKVVPNLNEDALKSARSSANNLGFTDDELSNMYDARFVALAWKAAQFDKLQSGKASAVASVQKAPPVVKPGATQTGQVAERRYKDVRQSLKKSGSLADAEKVFLARGFK